MKRIKYFKLNFLIVLALYLIGFYVYSISEKSLPGELNEVHINLQSEGKCSACHDPENKINFKKCLDCHDELLKRVTSLTGFHRDKTEDCSDCHREHRGKNSKLIVFDKSDFDHNETGFMLKGAHKKIINCLDCHSGSNSVKKKFTSSFFLHSIECKSCHKDVHNQMYPVCEECHSTDDWSVDIWN